MSLTKLKFARVSLVGGRAKSEGRRGQLNLPAHTLRPGTALPMASPE